MLRLKYMSRPNLTRPLAAVGVLAGALALTAGAAALTAEQPDGTVRIDRTAATALKCGVERWPVKTLSDPGASRVRKRAVPGTVNKLAHLPVGVGIGGIRGVGAELTRVRVSAKLVGIKGEPDGDLHLVIKDPVTGMKMIVEFPNETCTHGASAKLRAKMQQARVAVLAACGFTPNSRYHRVKGDVTVTGVPFFDFLHRQTGHAPNGVELHPVLRFTGHCTG
jgi:hypothetical protein